MSISKENFLKTIYLQEERPGGDTRPGTLARLLNISSAATTDMAQSLAQKNLVNYIKYQKLSLTSEGRKLALNVLRKHRLWEAFLHKTLDLSLREIHDEAERLEHLTSDYLADKIENYLNFPSSDPHGDPIPSREGEIYKSSDTVTLSSAHTGKGYIVVRLAGWDTEFFDFCASCLIEVGSAIFIENDFKKMKMIEITVEEKRLLLHREFTDRIYLKEREKN